MTSEHVPASLQRRVRARAHDRCEYCGISQELQEATFHIDHVVPRVDGGETTLENLALACVSCSLRKGPRRRALDPESATEVPLFNPRTLVWAEHLHLADDGHLEGLSPCGRATLELLKMNRPLAVLLRRQQR
jgi:hypothetical protein